MNANRVPNLDSHDLDAMHILEGWPMNAETEDAMDEIGTSDPHDSSVTEVDVLRAEIGKSCKAEEKEALSAIDSIDARWR